MNQGIFAQDTYIPLRHLDIAIHNIPLRLELDDADLHRDERANAAANDSNDERHG